MTPQSRDRNVARVRRFTAAIAGIALGACGLFAGLAASATQNAFSSSTTPTTSTERDDTESATTRRATTTAQATTTTTTTPTTVAPVTVTPAQSAPIASSGGS